MGADGINSIELFVLVGDGSRQWLEPQYVDKTIEPIGRIRVIIPEGPDHPSVFAALDISLTPVI